MEPYHSIPLHFQPIPGTRHQGIKCRHKENTDQQPREKTSDDDQRKGSLDEFEKAIPAD